MYPCQLKAPRVAVDFFFLSFFLRWKLTLPETRPLLVIFPHSTFTSLLSQSNFKHLHMPEYTPLLFPSRIQTLIQVSVSFESVPLGVTVI